MQNQMFITAILIKPHLSPAVNHLRAKKRAHLQNCSFFHSAIAPDSPFFYILFNFSVPHIDNPKFTFSKLIKRIKPQV